MSDAGTVIHGLEADHWVLTASPHGPQVAHESEVCSLQSLGACQRESRQVEELMEAEMEQHVKHNPALQANDASTIPT